MHKYTKTALVLLYLLQLMVVFREQLVHLYRSALESVKREAMALPERDLSDYRKVSGGPADLPKLSAPKAHVTMAAAAFIVVHTAILSEHGDEGEHPHHDGDENKDRHRKHKKRGFKGLLIANLWHFMRSLEPTGHRANPPADICRVLTFA